MKQIKDMFLIRKAMSFILILSLLTVPAFAATNTKSANFSCNSTPPSGFNLFHPTTGSITGTYNSASTTVSTKVNFSYTTAAVSKINCNVVFCKKTDHLSSGHFGLRGLYLYFSVLQHAKDAGNKPDIRRQERFDGFAVFPGGQV